MDFDHSGWAHPLNPVQTIDLVRMVIGETVLGSGYSRKVFVSAINEDDVVKVCAVGNFSNIREWELWQEVREIPRLRPWFAPCKSISPCGLILVQARTRPVPMQRMPQKVPAILTDLKIENWGLLKGKVVCHDYGNHKRNVPGFAMRKAHWWTVAD